MKYFVYFIIACLFIGCKKEKAGKILTIKGLIVESTGNPIPVSSYRLHIYQSSSQGLLGGVSGFDETFRTGNDGTFKFKYNASQNFGFSGGGMNTNNIRLTAVDSLQYKDLGPSWSPITGGMDINLDTLYLYKKIKTIIRKIKFDNGLEDGEKLDIITSNSPRPDYKTITGPFAAGTTLTLDTIRNCRMTWYDLTNQEYIYSATLKKPSYQKSLVIPLSKEDEEFMEVLMVY